jgi:hypothetical protein
MSAPRQLDADELRREAATLRLTPRSPDRRKRLEQIRRSLAAIDRRSGP